MVGTERSKEAVGMMALHEALRNVCLNSDWSYSVFWTIRPRPRSRGGNRCKVGDDNGSLAEAEREAPHLEDFVRLRLSLSTSTVAFLEMLMWEDGFCRPRVAECLEDLDGDDPVRKAFSKMSIQLYNYGEGLMGKVASDKCHKWVFKEPSESESNISNYWQSSFDAIPPEWTEQFASGIQTVAVIQAGYGLLQLGSCKIIPEDLHFVLRMRHTFESLGYQSGFYLSQLFSAARNGSASSSPTLVKPSVMSRPIPVINWAQRPLLSAPFAPNFSTAARPSLPKTDETHLFLHHHAHESQIDEMMDDADIKWPNGLSFFTALTGRTEDNGKLLFGSDSNVGGLSELGVSAQRNKTMHHVTVGKDVNSTANSNTTADASAEDHKETGQDSNGDAAANVTASEYLSLEFHGSETGDRFKMMDNKFKRSFTMPARMASSSADENHPRQGSDFRGSADTGIYSDIMETLLE